MLEGGFILLHRSILRWEWYGDLNTARLFIHLLLTVNYEPQRWQGIAVERGQRVASLAKLADETGLTVKQVRTALEHLKRTGGKGQQWKKEQKSRERERSAHGRAGGETGRRRNAGGTHAGRRRNGDGTGRRRCAAGTCVRGGRRRGYGCGKAAGAGGQSKIR